MLRAIEQGYVQREIQNAAYAYQRAVEAKEAIVVGVNEFASEGDVAVPIQRIDAALEAAAGGAAEGSAGAAGCGGSCGGAAGGGRCCAGWGESDAADSARG